MKIYLLGICGTFMAGIAMIARELGHEVDGADQNVYPPMSTQLEAAGIRLHQGYDAAALPDDADLIVVGNAISRGNPMFEAVLERGLRYVSAPQWLYESVLQPRWVLAVAGTHGKTTTSAMLAWILDQAGLDPGFLIGGLCVDFPRSARQGGGNFFVIEADEYDSALFDKRSKFVHYHPRTLVLNNLEFDHADIFDDLDDIKRQFHHLLRTLPASARVIHNADDAALGEVLEMGCWSEPVGLTTRPGNGDFLLHADGRLVDKASGKSWRIELDLPGEFNRRNAAAAVLAARHVGVPIEESVAALGRFRGVRRRQEVLAEPGGVRVVDDFAHHPTAIAQTLEALAGATAGRLIAVIEIRSNTMKLGSHGERLAGALAAADEVFFVETPNLQWDIRKLSETAPTIVRIEASSQQIIDRLCQTTRPGDQIVIMSNGGFDNIHRRLIEALREANL